MKLSKKLFAAALAMIMTFSAVPMTAFAQSEEATIIDSIDVTVNLDDIVGESPSDFSERVSVSQEGLRIGESIKVTTKGEPVIPTDSFEYGKSYWMHLTLYVEEGYNLNGYVENSGYNGDNLSVTVNGENMDFFYKFDKTPLMYFESTYCVYPQHYTEKGDLRVCVYYEFEVHEKDTGILGDIGKAFKNFFESIATFFTDILFQPVADVIMDLLNKI